MIGIYKITCKSTGKFYIGSSINIEKRWREHAAQLKNGRHHSILLQRAWDKYGVSDFIFEVVEETDRQTLLNREQFYLDSLKPFDKTIGLNISPKAQNNVMYGSKHPMFGKHITENMRTALEKPKSEQAKLNMSLNHADVSGANNPMYGKTRDENVKMAISLKNKDRFKGEKSQRAVITRETAEEAKQLHATKKYTQMQIAGILNMNRSTLCNIIYGRSWQ